MAPDCPVAAARQLAAAPAIEAAARELNVLRENWLFPADLIIKQAEVVDGLPARRMPKSIEAKQTLSRRTLTILYNDRPDWLLEAHRALDEAVAAAYGWSADISDGDALERLLQLNQQRSGQKGQAGEAGTAGE